MGLRVEFRVGYLRIMIQRIALNYGILEDVFCVCSLCVSLSLPLSLFLSLPPPLGFVRAS